jgi:hypothetical protein
MAEPLARSKTQLVLVTYFPMFIATLSLCTSIYNGYLNSRFIDLIQHNTARVEALHTCKEIIDAYFQIKFRIEVLSGNAEGAAAGSATTPTPSAARIEATNAITKFAALGTYLANLRDDATRERYTALTDELAKIAAQAPRTSRGTGAKLFETADRLFATMNDDCVKTAKSTTI